jgi:large subunit ribosomal protein L15
MYLHDLSPAEGSVRDGKRKGRGRSSGMGKTSSRGHKGQKSRSGSGTRRGFEGGQMPLARRVPKRGFNNIFAKPLTTVNVAALNQFRGGAKVDAGDLLKTGVISKCPHGVKILGNGKLTKKLTVRAAAFSKSAKDAIEAAGGKAVISND